MFYSSTRTRLKTFSVDDCHRFCCCLFVCLFDCLFVCLFLFFVVVVVVFLCVFFAVLTNLRVGDIIHSLYLLEK